ncbi:hypothetical protein VE02_06152 [Pseudogymnoascus sp. 03VT05]|nr:hypothetical protein VE02_06152 [Pseudogymnoascus sp. 03VT05]
MAGPRKGIRAVQHNSHNPNRKVNKKTKSELSEAEKKAQEDFKSEREENKGGPAANAPTLLEITANEPARGDEGAEAQSRSSLLGLPKRIAKERLEALCYDIDGPGETQFPIINLAELQRLNIYALRKKLAVKAIDIFQSESLCDNEAWRIKDLMSDYCNALRDFDYMLQKDDIEIERDPFYLMYSRWCDWAIMRPVVDKLYKSKKVMMEIPRDHEDAEMIGDARAWTKQRARDASFYKRFWFGLAGGLALINPMLLILLHHDRVTALAMASVATVFFAVTMAFYHEADRAPWLLWEQWRRILQF